MASLYQLVVFFLDQWRYALRLDAVVRVVRSVEITPLPEAPEVVLGLINYGGTIVPVMNLRRRFRLPPRAARPQDHLLLARTAKRSVALPVDRVGGVREFAARDCIPAAAAAEGTQYVSGIVRLPDGLLLIHDLESFLTDREDALLEETLNRRQASA